MSLKKNSKKPKEIIITPEDVDKATKYMRKGPGLRDDGLGIHTLSINFVEQPYLGSAMRLDEEPYKFKNDEEE